MSTALLSDLTLIAIDSAVAAGREIMNIYNTGFTTSYKSDESPLTTADIAANTIINEKLKDSGFPILSEEGKEIDFFERRKWQRFWLVDPLDGTKEFIKRNGEFTVNIALINANTPVIGVIYAPVKGLLYFANPEIGSYFIDGILLPDKLLINELEQLIRLSKKLPFFRLPEEFTVLSSRSHQSPETSAIIEKIRQSHPDVNLVNTGSSLKFCRLAEGSAHYYPRFSPTMEWDTAAGHAIAQYAGILIKTFPDGVPLTYNKEVLVNPWFVAYQAGIPDFTG